MKKIFFTAALFAALSLGFVSCENPDDEPGFSLENEQGDNIVEVKLTVKTNNSDYGMVTGSGHYDVGEEATITATPKENYYFTGWSDSDSKELTRTVQVNSDTTITAIFSEKPYLTAKPNSSDYGTVTGSGHYEVGSEATITATPNYDYIEFVQWSDGNTENPRTITLITDITYTATFKVDLPDGAFLVDDSGKCVYFSPGNLQYTRSTDTWSFAENQYDYIGTDNVIGGSVSFDPTDGDSKSGDALADKIDLFGWSGSTGSAKFGVSNSTNYSDYWGSFVDWGTNQIGTDTPNTWRTLTNDEYRYLLNQRPNASSLCGVAEINGVNGLILLPDNWTCPAGVTVKSGFHNGFEEFGASYYSQYQSFSSNEWSKLEAVGAVFLPAAGGRGGSVVGSVREDGKYWTSTKYDYYFVYCLSSSSTSVFTFCHDRFYGKSVRLVKDL